MTTQAHAAEAVRTQIPDAKHPDDGHGDEDSYNAGWNACREAMLAAAPQQAAEPVGWMASADLDELAYNRKESENGVDAIEIPVSSHPFGHMNVPVYTHPQPAQDAKSDD